MKILFLIPHHFIPTDSGNKNLTYNLLKYVTRQAQCDLLILGDRAALFESHEAAIRAALPHVGMVKYFEKPRGIQCSISRMKAALGMYHPSPGNFASAELHRWIEEHVVDGVYDLVHFDMMHMAQYRSAVRNVPTLLVASDAYSNAACSARVLSKSTFRTIRILIDEILLRRVERVEYPHFDLVCTVSCRDADYLKGQSPGARFETIGIAVGEEYRDRSIRHFVEAREAFSGILCTGTLSHDIVAAGVSAFIRQMAPRLRRRWPGQVITILGRNPTPELLRVMTEEPLVRHIDYVDDYPDFLDRDWIYVYPQQCGSGLQTKLQQAMALGLPVAAFPIAFGGMTIESCEHCKVCQSHEEIADWVENLLEKPAERRRIGLNASAYVREQFSIQRVGAQVMQLYGKLLKQRKRY